MLRGTNVNFTSTSFGTFRVRWKYLQVVYMSERHTSMVSSVPARRDRRRNNDTSSVNSLEYALEVALPRNLLDENRGETF